MTEPGQPPSSGRVSFPALGTTATLLLADGDPDRLAAARAVLDDELAAIDLACSRFRPDSELSQANRAAGHPVAMSALLSEAVGVALRAARLTGGAVDPTVGAQLCALGYDRTFAEVTPQLRDSPARPAPGWEAVVRDGERQTLTVPAGAWLDLGATAKALAADRAAAGCAAAAGCGVLVNLGGDIRVAGTPPAGGWPVGISADHRRADTPGSCTVLLASGGLATSSTAVRCWRRGRRTVHHIVDPVTGDNPIAVWRTASVTAASCVDANTAATAAIVLGHRAPGWLESLGLPARLMAVDGTVRRVAGWPVESVRLAAGGHPA